REVRDRRLRLGHPAGDDLLDPGGLLDRHLTPAGLAAARGRLLALGLLGGLARIGLRRAAGRRGLDVGLHDPPAGAGALERREVDPVLAGDPPRDGGGLRPAAVALRGRGGLRRGLGAAVAVAVLGRRRLGLGRRLRGVVVAVVRRRLAVIRRRLAVIRRGLAVIRRGLRVIRRGLVV